MELTENYYQARREALSWLKSKERDFATGLRILQNSGYKPQVSAKIAKWGNTHHAQQKLEWELGEFIKIWAAEAQDVEFVSSDNNDQDNELEEDLKKIIETPPSDELHLSIQKIIYTVADDYKARSILHKELGELPEDNTDETMTQRKTKTQAIAALSKQMSVLYALKKRYDADGTIPTDEEMNEAFFDPDAQPEESTELPTDKEELKKLRKSEATKLLRAKNQLLYQQDTRTDTENPMPDCPKRVKYETKISALEKRVTDIDYKIAELG